MYNTAALLDIHSRTNYCLETLFDHCDQLSQPELHQAIPGFGYSTIHLQLHHLIGAEEYWVGVLQGRVDVNDSSEKYQTIEALRSYRKSVFTATARYLAAISEDELNRASEMETWGGNRRQLVPAHVIMRTVTHIHHHLGQILAMCRLLGKPASGCDFPIIDSSSD